MIWSKGRFNRKPGAEKSGGRNVWFRAVFTIGLVVMAIGIAGVYLTTGRLSDFQQLAYRYQDVAGRQRAIVQRMQTDLYTIAYLQSQRRPADNAELDLFQATTLFQSTLQVLLNGGKTQDSSGSVVAMPPLADARANGVAQRTSERWAPLKDALSKIDTARTPDERDVTSALSVSDDAIADLIDLSNELTARLDELGADQAAIVGKQRLYAAGAAGFGFLVILAGFFARLLRDQRRLRQSSDELSVTNKTLSDYSTQLAVAKQGTDAIMSTVRQGLFLINSDIVVQGEYSNELEAIFEQEHLEDRPFFDLMRPLLSDKMQEVTRRYIALLFDSTKRDRAVMQANPLDPIDLSFANPAGGYRTKSVTFSFRRIRIGEQITRVFVSATDITERVQLEQEMRETEERKERQLELMLDLVQADPAGLADFITTMERDLSDINSTLRADDFSEKGGVPAPVLRQRLDTIYRCVHNIKGNAALVGINAIAQSADSFETKLSEMRQRSKTTGEDFLAAVVCQSELSIYLTDITGLRDKLAGMQQRPVPQPVAAKPAPAAPPALSSFAALATRIGEENGRSVRLATDGYDIGLLPESAQSVMKDVLIQLVRNSVVHGIEEPAARVAQGKPAVGTITIATVLDRKRPGSASLVYR
ncbi:MAG: Hpt domain-containing protein, partial [Vulcanimicrobiaceae bacterium]